MTKPGQDSNETLKNILNGIDAYLYVSDPETDEILFINDKMREHFNLTEDAVGKICWKVLQSGFEERCSFCPNRLLLEYPGSSQVWEEHNTVTGRYYKNSDRIIDWAGGRKAHLQHSTDITDAKLAELSLKKQLKQQELMSAISQSFSSADADNTCLIPEALKMAGLFMGVNHVFLSKYEKGKNALTCQYEWFDENGHSYIENDSDWPITPDMDIYKEFAQKRHVAVSDFSLLSHPNFQTLKGRELRAFLNVPIEVSGEFWGILGFIVNESVYDWKESDIHLGKLIAGVLSGVISRSAAEENLYDTQQKMAAVFENAPLAIYWKDGGLRFGGCNSSFAKFVGKSPEEIMGKTNAELFDKKIAKRFQDLEEEALRTALPSSGDMQTRSGKGELRWIHFNRSVILDNKKRPAFIIGVFEDITEDKMLEEQLVIAKDIAEKSSKAKGEFLSRMSHEIRTPMNAIIGMTSIAKSTKDPAKKEYCLDKIDDASKHLLGVINDILDISKIEAEKFELSYDEFDFETMLKNVVDVLVFKADEKRHDLVVNMSGNIPHMIIGDELRLTQVIANLLSNAIKFTPQGGVIKLNVNILEENEDGFMFKVEVVDNGIGVSPEQQTRLFQSFEQADGGIPRKYGGTGLGLAISKRIVEKMGGRIWIKSELGHGSTFSFTFKAEKGKSQLVNKFAQGIDRENLKILAVDDSLETREYFLHLMRTLDLPCDVAADAYEAMEMVEGRGEGNQYNVFFIDWQMPGMNGVELSKKIKEKLDDSAVIIMISVAEWSDIEKEASEAGINRFISKPLFPSTLVNVINESMGISPKQRSDASERIQAGDHKYKNHVMLLAEDMEINREIITTLLEDTELVIESAETGLEAFEKFSKNPRRYSIIFMDIHMPIMNGYEATRKIRALDYKEATTVPIIAMTADVFKEDVEKCIEAGMNGHVGKPVNTGELLQKLDLYLRPRAAPLETGAAAESTKTSQTTGEESKEQEIKGNATENQTAGAESAEKQPVSSAFPADTQVMDVEDGLRRLMNSKKLYFSLLKNFMSGNMSSDLAGSITSGDVTKTAQSAHALKGVAANLGLTALKDVATDIEMRAKMGMSAESYLETLEGAAEATFAAIRSLLEREGVK